MNEFDWYTHTGIAGWFFVLDGNVIPIYILFLIALIVFPYWVVARFIGSTSMVPVLHVAALGYVFHGWYSAPIGFIAGLFWCTLLWRLIKGITFLNNASMVSVSAPLVNSKPNNN